MQRRSPIATLLSQEKRRYCRNQSFKDNKTKVYIKIYSSYLTRLIDFGIFYYVHFWLCFLQTFSVYCTLSYRKISIPYEQINEIGWKIFTPEVVHQKIICAISKWKWRVFSADSDVFQKYFLRSGFRQRDANVRQKYHRREIKTGFREEKR